MHTSKQLFCFIIILAATMLPGCGKNGSAGAPGSKGAPGPSIPVIQSISATGLPASPGSSITLRVSAESGDNLPLTYSWQATGGWSIVSGGTTSTVVITAPAAHSASGSATVTVTDSNSRAATGMIGLTTQDGSWGATTLLETDNAGDAVNPRVAMDPNGNATAVWFQSDGTVYNIVANRFEAGSGWGTPISLETDTVNMAINPSVAMDPAGDAVAVWQQTDGIEYSIWTNRYDALLASWGTPTLLETNTGAASFPRVAMDSSGNAIAVWYQANGSFAHIWANRYTVGSGWGTAELIETSADSSLRVEIAMDPAGNAIAVWDQTPDGTHTSVWTNRYAVGTGWGTAELLETNLALNAMNPQIAIDQAGNAVAVWQQSDGTYYNIWSNRYVAGIGWAGPSIVETDAHNDQTARIAVDASGNAMAVWLQNDGTRLNVRACRYDAAAGWGAAALIETENMGSAGTPSLVMDPAGNAIAAWAQSDGIRANILSNRYVAGAGWGNAELIEYDNAGNAAAPNLAVDPDGDALAVWHQSDGAVNNIWANLFH